MVSLNAVVQIDADEMILIYLFYLTGVQKVTTTFGPTDLIQTSMHVNGNTRTYESTTLNRKNKLNQMSIDEEITAASRRVGVNPASQSRTLERRKIQNSEC